MPVLKNQKLYFLAILAFEDKPRLQENTAVCIKISLHEVKDAVLWAFINLGTIFYQGGSEHWRGKFHFQCASPQKPKAVFSCNLGLSTFYGQEYIILRASPGLGVQAPPQM